MNKLYGIIDTTKHVVQRMVVAIGGEVRWNMKGCVMSSRVIRELIEERRFSASIDPLGRPWIKWRSASIR